MQCASAYRPLLAQTIKIPIDPGESPRSGPRKRPFARPLTVGANVGRKTVSAYIKWNEMKPMDTTFDSVIAPNCSAQSCTRLAGQEAALEHGACRARSSSAPWHPGALTRTVEATVAENAVLVLDHCARIRFCTAAAGRVFGQRPDDVLSANVTTLIPRLPLRPNTPGYNLAYAAFQAGSIHPRKFRARHAHGYEFSLDVAIKPLTLQGRHGLVVELLVPQARDIPAVESRKEISCAGAKSMDFHRAFSRSVAPACPHLLNNGTV